MKIVGGYDNGPLDSATICERCGAPIKHVVWVEDDDGEIMEVGTSCAQRLVGNALVERATREAMKRRWKEVEQAKRRMSQPKQRDLYVEVMQAICDGDNERRAELRALIQEHGRFLEAA